MKNKTEETKRDLASRANAQPDPKDYSNKANIKGGVEKGKQGTKATASQQQGQGAWNKKNNDDNRTGTKSGGGGSGQGANNPTGK